MRKARQSARPRFFKTARRRVRAVPLDPGSNGTAVLVSAVVAAGQDRRFVLLSHRYYRDIQHAKEINEMKDWKRAAGLFLRFFSFGCFTFGGGWGIIAQMHREYVDKQRILTEQELLDTTSLGKSLPGVMISNTAFLFGYRVCGIPGGLACVFGVALPPIIILTVITIFYRQFRSNPYIVKMMNGVRAAVVPIILNALIRLCKGTYPYKSCVLITCAAFFLNFFFGVGCAVIVLLSATAGILICRMKGGRNEDGNS